MKRSELKEKIKNIIFSKLRIYPPPPPSKLKEVNKFSELKYVLIDLLTEDYDKFISSIDWVSPRHSTFRINLKNHHFFYLSKTRNAWVAEIEGKLYYLNNITEEENAVMAISMLLRYINSEEKEEETPINDDTSDTDSETDGGEESSEEFDL
jgi:hypothetical protein